MANRHSPGRHPRGRSPESSITRSSAGSSAGGIIVTVKDFIGAALGGSKSSSEAPLVRKINYEFL